MKRRIFLQASLASGGLGLAEHIGLLKAQEMSAPRRWADAFEAENEPAVIRSLFGVAAPAPSDAVRIDAPLQAKHGAAVPVKVWCEMAGVEVIALMTANNRHPLNTFLRISGAGGYYSIRIKVERSSPVTAYVKAGAALYSASVHIKVTHGGYGVHAG